MEGLPENTNRTGLLYKLSTISVRWTIPRSYKRSKRHTSGQQKDRQPLEWDREPPMTITNQVASWMTVGMAAPRAHASVSVHRKGCTRRRDLCRWCQLWTDQHCLSQVSAVWPWLEVVVRTTKAPKTYWTAETYQAHSIWALVATWMIEYRRRMVPQPLYLMMKLQNNILI